MGGDFITDWLCCWFVRMGNSAFITAGSQMFGICMMMVKDALTKSAQLGGDSVGTILVAECGWISLSSNLRDERKLWTWVVSFGSAS